MRDVCRTKDNHRNLCKWSDAVPCFRLYFLETSWSFLTGSQVHSEPFLERVGNVEDKADIEKNLKR